MIQTVLLRLHRWMFLTFAIPLAVIIVTGLILSFQPILQTAGIKPGTITLAQIETYLAKYDPDGKAHGGDASLELQTPDGWTAHRVTRSLLR